MILVLFFWWEYALLTGVSLLVGALVSGVICFVAGYHHGLREALNICGRGGGG